MAYSSQADLISRYGETELIQLTDRDGLLGGIDAVVLSAALSDADAEIDGYLRAGGYALPLASVPAELLRHASQMARYYLYDGERPEYVRQDYQDSQRWLGLVASGRVRLEDARAGGPGVIAAPIRTLIYPAALEGYGA